MKNDLAQTATTGMPYTHKAHMRADYLASPALISKHGRRPACQPVSGRPTVGGGGAKEKAAISPSQLTTLMAGLVGLWVEAERPEDVPPASNVHKLLTSTRVWLSKYHRHREKHNSFANHPNCKGCRGLHAVEQYCTNQLRLAVSSGDPLRVREVQGALSQMRVAPLPLEVRSPLPMAPVVTQSAPRSTVREAMRHPAQAHRHVLPAAPAPSSAPVAHPHAYPHAPVVHPHAYPRAPVAHPHAYPHAPQLHHHQQPHPHAMPVPPHAAMHAGPAHVSVSSASSCASSESGDSDSGHVDALHIAIPTKAGAAVRTDAVSASPTSTMNQAASEFLAAGALHSMLYSCGKPKE